MLDGLTSLLLLLSLLILRTLIVRAIAKNPTFSMEAKRRWAVSVRNTMVFVLLVGLVVIRAHELQAFAVFLVALGFATKLLEIGQGPASHFYTGRVTVFPNSLLFTNALVKENPGQEYGLHILVIPLRDEDD